MNPSSTSSTPSTPPTASTSSAPFASLVRWHGRSALVVGSFALVHLGHQLVAPWGARLHGSVGASLRIVYRHPFIELVLWAAVLVQVATGLLLWRGARDQIRLRWQRWSGLILALFLLQHGSAVLVQRHWFGGETDFAWAAAVLHFPAALYFVPYYTLGVTCFVFHVGAALKREWSLGSFALGLTVALTILWGLVRG